MLDRKKFYKFYDTVMNLDSRIRFVTIIDKTGTILYGGQREGIENYLSEQDQKKSLEHVLNSWFLRNQVSEGIGSGKYATAEYEKVKRFTFPLNDSYFLYITTEPDLNSCEFVDNILNMIDSFGAPEKNILFFALIQQQDNPRYDNLINCYNSKLPIMTGFENSNCIFRGDKIVLAEIVFVFDNKTNERILEMRLTDFIHLCSDRIMYLEGHKYKILSTERIPATDSSHNDTVFTHIYVEEINTT